MRKAIGFGALGLLLTLQAAPPQAPSSRPGGSLPALRVLVVTAVEGRGSSYKEFLEANALSCTVADFFRADEKLMEDHDVVVIDDTQGRLRESRELWNQTAARVKAMPRTSRPVLGMGYAGHLYLRKFDIALGKVKT